MQVNLNERTAETAKKLMDLGKFSKYEHLIAEAFNLLMNVYKAKEEGCSEIIFKDPVTYHQYIETVPSARFVEKRR